MGDFDFCPQLIIPTIDHPYHLTSCLPSLVLGCYISSAAHSYKNNYCLPANEINNVVVGYQLPGTQLRLVQNSRLFPDFSKTIVYFPDSRLPNRWSIETLKNAGINLFSRRTSNVSNEGTMRTYKSLKNFSSVIKCLGYRQD